MDEVKELIHAATNALKLGWTDVSEALMLEAERLCDGDPLVKQMLVDVRKIRERKDE